MTEEEAIEYVNEVGMAFDNDYNDGDGPVAYGGVNIVWSGGHTYLVAEGILKDQTKFKWRWALIPVEHKEDGEDK